MRCSCTGIRWFAQGMCWQAPAAPTTRPRTPASWAGRSTPMGQRIARASSGDTANDCPVGMPPHSACVHTGALGSVTTLHRQWAPVGTHHMYARRTRRLTRVCAHALRRLLHSAIRHGDWQICLLLVGACMVDTSLPSLFEGYVVAMGALPNPCAQVLGIQPGLVVQHVLRCGGMHVCTYICMYNTCFDMEACIDACTRICMPACKIMCT